MNVTAILFDGFETLDMFGPVEMLGASGEFETKFYSLDGVRVPASNAKHGTFIVRQGNTVRKVQVK